MGDPGAVESLRRFALLVLAHLGEGDRVDLGIAARRNERGHATHRERTPAVAGLHEQLAVGAHERDGHGHGAPVRKDHLRPMAELLDHAEDVVPAAGIEAGRVLAQLEEDLVHLEGGQDRLDQDGRLDRPLRDAEALLRPDEDVVPEASLEVRLELRQIEVAAVAAVVAEEVEPEVEQRRRTSARRRPRSGVPPGASRAAGRRAPPDRSPSTYCFSPVSSEIVRSSASVRLRCPSMQFAQVGEFESSKSAMKTRAPELSALITILRSTGPVISTRRSAISSGVGATRQASARTSAVSGRKSGSSPAWSRSSRSARRASSSTRRAPNVALQVVQEAACFVGEDVGGVDHPVDHRISVASVASSAAATRSACCFGEDERRPDLDHVRRAGRWRRRGRRDDGGRSRRACRCRSCPVASPSSSTPTKRPGPRTCVIAGCARGHLGETFPEVRTDALGLLGEPFALDHVEHGRADGRRHRVSRRTSRRSASARRTRPRSPRVVTTAPIGCPLPIGFPSVTMSGTTPSCAKPQYASPDTAEAGLYLVGDAECAGGARSARTPREVAGRDGEDAVAREDVVADQEAPARVLPRRSRAKASSTSSATSCGGIRRAERRSSADPRDPGLERGRAELLGRESGRGSGRAVVGVLGDHRPAVARDRTGDLHRDVVRLAAGVDEHDDGELARGAARPGGRRRPLPRRRGSGCWSSAVCA